MYTVQAQNAVSELRSTKSSRGPLPNVLSGVVFCCLISLFAPLIFVHWVIFLSNFYFSMFTPWLSFFCCHILLANCCLKMYESKSFLFFRFCCSRAIFPKTCSFELSNFSMLLLSQVISSSVNDIKDETDDNLKSFKTDREKYGNLLFTEDHFFSHTRLL